MSIQQLLLGVGGAKSTYVDDVYSTYTYKGSSSSQTLNTGLDFSNEGGLTWIRRRTGSEGYVMVDTLRGTSKILQSNSSGAEQGNTDVVPSFTSTGHATGTHSSVNESGANYISWNFRKCPGFFDIVSWTGDGGTSKTISHSLGSVPGSIWVKCTSHSDNWIVFHRGLDRGNQPETHHMRLNDSSGAYDDLGKFNDTAPTATNFTVGVDINTNSRTYVAYVFAGGKSAAATAKSMNWADGSDRLKVGSSSSKSADLNFGSGDLSIELWIKAGSTQDDRPNLICIGDDTDRADVNLMWDHESYVNKISFWAANKATTPFLVSNAKGWNNDGQWHHVAVTRASNVWRLFMDGIEEATTTWTGDTTDANNYLCIGNTTTGAEQANNAHFTGRISNVRIVKGTAVYTSSFTPPIEPLANITNTVLLTVNNSSRTGSTVTPLTISEVSLADPTDDSPFDDPAGYVFGASGKENIIKCGTYCGNGSNTISNPVEVEVGFEPDFLLIKPAEYGEHWHHFDSIRGMGFGNDTRMEINVETSSPETSSIDYFDIHPKGFKAINNNINATSNGGLVSYIAIRRRDGYVGKPADAATDVFAIANRDTTAPAFNANFPVDLAMYKRTTNSTDWRLGMRLIQGLKVYPNATFSADSDADFTYDYMDGWSKNTNNHSDVDSWMWKRGTGLDCLYYNGDGVTGRYIPHNLAATPEMIWIKDRENTREWNVYHKGFNGGTNPEQYYMVLNTDAAEVDSQRWNDVAPTSTHFCVSNSVKVNDSGQGYIAMLFRSVPGISKAGYYDAANTDVTVSVGFQPKFIIAKKSNGGDSWCVFDTHRGWATTDNGMSQRLSLSSDAAQANDQHTTTLTSDGFIAEAINGNMNGGAGGKYFYYCHA